MDPAPRITSPTLAPGEGQYEVLTGDGHYVVAPHRAPDAISALFMASGLSGEVSVNPSLGSSTDWIISFPTRHAYVADLPGSLTADGATVPPFKAEFTADGACEQFGVERNARDGSKVQLASTASRVTLCSQVNVHSIGADGGFDGGETIDLTGEGRDVWVRDAETGEPVALKGLPAVGIRATSVINNNVAAGVKANYTMATPLRRQTGD